MRAILASVVMAAVTLLLLGGIEAGEKKADKGKEVVLKGKITCAKCDLGKEAKCATVIVAKHNDKEEVFYFDPAAGKKHHAKICTEAHDGTVTGTISTEGEKKVITVKKVEFK